MRRANFWRSEWKHNHWRRIRKHSAIYWQQIYITNNELRYYECTPKFPRQLNWWPIIFLPVSQRTPMWTRGTKNQTSPTEVRNAQFYVGSNSHVFTYINIFTYIWPINYNVQVINDNKVPAKCFSIVIIEPPKTNIIIPLWASYCTKKNPQNTIIQTALKSYNQFIRIITESLRWLKPRQI